MIRASIASLSTVLLASCSGHLYTVLNPDITSQEGKPMRIVGVLAYPVINVIEIYETTILEDEKTKKVISHAPKCLPVRSMKFSTRADYNKPYQIMYEPGWLEMHTFGVELKDGVLASVNTTSDPSKTAAVAMEALPFIAAPKTAAIPSVNDKKLCNAVPKFLGVFKAPDVLPYEQIPN